MNDPTIKIAALLIWCGVSLSATMPEYRKIHRDVWSSDGVCRHAAAYVYRRAMLDGDDAKVIVLGVKNPGKYWFHVVPLVKSGGSWWAIETSRKYGTISRRWRGQRYSDWFQSLGTGRELSGFYGEEKDWIIEKCYLEFEYEILPEFLSNNRRKVALSKRNRAVGNKGSSPARMAEPKVVPAR